MGNGVINVGNDPIFEPTNGSLIVRLSLGSHFDATRTQHNDLRAAGVNAGGMSNVSAAYAAIKSAMDGMESGRSGWLDRWTTGDNGTETDLNRRAVVWHYVSRGEVPSPPQP